MMCTYQPRSSKKARISPPLLIFMTAYPHLCTSSSYMFINAPNAYNDIRKQRHHHSMAQQGTVWDGGEKPEKLSMQPPTHTCLHTSLTVVMPESLIGVCF